MPSIKVTPTKGLFQAKGTSAIPNGSLSGHKRVVLDKDDDYTLTVADSGKVITMSKGSAMTITLPSVSDSKGCYFTVEAATAFNHVITELVSADTNVLTLISVQATATTRAHAFTTATLSAGQIGDRFNIYSDGTFWVITALSEAAVTAA